MSIFTFQGEGMLRVEYPYPQPLTICDVTALLAPV